MIKKKYKTNLSSYIHSFFFIHFNYYCSYERKLVNYLYYLQIFKLLKKFIQATDK